LPLLLSLGVLFSLCFLLLPPAQSNAIPFLEAGPEELQSKRTTWFTRVQEGGEERGERRKERKE
jgi:hypothetical protein